METLSEANLTDEIEKYIERDCLLATDQVSDDKVKELCTNLKFNIPQDQIIRIVRIGDFPFSPCGGTHVKSLKELKGLEITHMKIKNRTLKVYYTIH